MLHAVSTVQVDERVTKAARLHERLAAVTLLAIARYDAIEFVAEK